MRAKRFDTRWNGGARRRRAWLALIPAIFLVLSAVAPAMASEGGAAPAHKPGGEANLILPDLDTGSFMGMTGHKLLLFGLLASAAGLAFGIVTYGQLKRKPVHESMREISELIYETCKTYLIQQGKLLLVLELFIEKTQ